MTEGFCRSPIDISPSIAYNIDAKLRICDRGFTSKEQSRNAPGIAVPRAFFYAGGRAHPLSLALLDSSPEGGALGIRFTFRSFRLSAPRPTSAARFLPHPALRATFPSRGRLCVSRANRSEAPDPENTTACQGLSLWESWQSRQALTERASLLKGIHQFFSKNLKKSERNLRFMYYRE